MLGNTAFVFLELDEVKLALAGLLAMLIKVFPRILEYLALSRKDQLILGKCEMFWGTEPRLEIFLFSFSLECGFCFFNQLL